MTLDFTVDHFMGLVALLFVSGVLLNLWCLGRSSKNKKSKTRKSHGLEKKAPMKSQRSHHSLCH